MLYDPVNAMLGRQAENRSVNQVRNKLQLHARNLIQKAHRLRGSEPEHADILRMIGELEGYLAVREGLAPMVGQDGYRHDMARCVAQLKSLLEGLNDG